MLVCVTQEVNIDLTRSISAILYSLMIRAESAKTFSCQTNSEGTLEYQTNYIKGDFQIKTDRDKTKTSVAYTTLSICFCQNCQYASVRVKNKSKECD